MHYIVLMPTGKWSALPDAGQVYRYTDVPALLTGGELRLRLNIWHRLHYTLQGEFAYMLNLDNYTALPFSPPASMRNTISWDDRQWQVFLECQSVAPQHNVCYNEDPTKGYTLLHAGGSIEIPIRRYKLNLMLHATNLTNRSYMNHLSFYRRIDLPEAGINIQTTIKFIF